MLRYWFKRERIEDDRKSLDECGYALFSLDFQNSVPERHEQLWNFYMEINRYLESFSDSPSSMREVMNSHMQRFMEERGMLNGRVKSPM